MGINPEVISDDYSEYEYLCQMLPGSSVSWKTLAEEVMGLKECYPKYQIQDKLKEIEQELYLSKEKKMMLYSYPQLKK